mmetsp:Transcript_21263/g.49324  ORF Transcript_21263/g.49324 Transcript_21263/m.49324 type:complete len:436 (-) Transcript_21263:396-1703(-)|eukprot:CAMPEP_0178404490 /NCGR_PEP_ID=MMETSP0689_2-20121128/17912_1 /TAXON_ID=160604 /ORGANISM="Amphidinium massartii, Strain CS-259" /LENGTH=435 /DNA_ID=CAMNT_0020025479 /DNA_START=87 /DNA_END=1397 /DNA_ORIENTATION=+
MSASSYKKINGETRAQMQHARELKAQKADTTVDQEWTVNQSLRISDCYVYITSGMWLLIKTPLLIFFVFFSALPMCILARCWGAFLKTPTDEVTSGRCGLFLLCFPFVAVYMFLALFAFCLDTFVYYLFSLPFFVLRLLFCGCCHVRLCGSYSTLRPYSYGPFVFTHVTDLLVALVGQVLRHGVIESAWRCSVMVVVVPWLKYYIAVNPLIYNLDERFVTQISTSMQDMPTEDVSLTARRIISRTKQETGLRMRQDMWEFAPHYPYPPAGRNYALGLQAGGQGIFGTFLVVHTTHALEVGSSKLRDPDWLILSNSVALPAYRVMLWYNNPFHQFTGFVEASTTTGAPSQLDKHLGGEHPMWLVATHSPMLSGRKGVTGPGSVDGFFDRWLPKFVDEVRTLLRGKEYAEQMHEEVISKDGVSRPAGKKHVKPLEAA